MHSSCRVTRREARPSCLRGPFTGVFGLIWGYNVPNALNVTMQNQRQTEWCWAAVAICVAQLMGNPQLWDQCSLAGAQLGQPGNFCCMNGGDPNTCNKPAKLEDSLSRVQHFSTTQNPNPAQGVPDPGAIKQEIDGSRPIGVRIQWDQSGNQGHYVLVTGYDDSTDDFKVFINDPENPDGAPYTAYSLAALNQSGYQSSGKSGSWSFTYYTA